jgi:cardiolipin synthase
MFMINSSVPITCATLITLVRFVLVPPLVIALAQHAWKQAIIILACASVSDMLDGWVARFFNQQTQLGTYLDPLADKFLVLACYLTMFLGTFPVFVLPVWFMVLVVMRELSIVVGSGFVGMYLKKPFAIKPTVLGKLAMAAQMLFMLLFFIAQSAYSGVVETLPMCTWQRMVVQSVPYAWYAVILLLIASWVQYVYYGIKEL